MRRRALVLAIWLVGTAAATTMALAATNLVGNRVTDAPRSTDASGLAAGSTSTTTSALPSSTSTATSVEVIGSTPPGTGTAPTSGPTGTSPTTAPPPPPTSPPPTATTRTFQSEGGTLGAACEGSAVRLVWASPKDGFAAEVHDPGPAELDVRFSSEEHESRVKVRCTAGAPVAEVEERGDSSGSGSD